MPEVGAYFVTKTPSFFGQVIRWATRSPVNHAGIYIGSGLIVDAQPKGARACRLSQYPNAIWSDEPLTRSQGLRIATEALSLVGTPYSWLDIAALAWSRVLKRGTPRWVRHRLERNDRLICSQLVDLCYRRNGVVLFLDKSSCDVTPGDLYTLIGS